MTKLKKILLESRYTDAVKHIRPRKTIWIKGNSGYIPINIKNVELGGRNTISVTDTRGKSYEWDTNKVEFMWEDPKLVAARQKQAEEDKLKKQAEKEAKRGMRKSEYTKIIKQAATPGSGEWGDDWEGLTIARDLMRQYPKIKAYIVRRDKWHFNLDFISDRDILNYEIEKIDDYDVAERIQWDLEAIAFR